MTEPNETPPEDEEVAAPWTFKLVLTLIPFLLIAGLLFLEGCPAG